MAADLFLVILGEIPRIRFVSPLDRPRILGCFAHGNLEKRRFSYSVRPDDGDPFATHDGQADILKDLLIAITLGYP